MPGEVLAMVGVPPPKRIGEGPWPSPRPPLQLVWVEVSTMAEVPPPKHVGEGLRPLLKPPHKHSQEEPRPWLRPPKHLDWGWTLAIAKINPSALLALEKKQRGAPSSSRVSSLVWALAWAHWSSSKQTIATSNIFKSLKLKARKGTYLLTCYSMQWRDLNLKMNKNHILYTLKP